MPFRFEGLEIWQRAREFSAKVHAVTCRFPRNEFHALADQLNRAADAVPLLIAEGSRLQTKSLFSHRLGLAVGETFEVVSGSFLALDRNYITREVQAEMYEWGEALARKINAFRNTLK